MRELSGQKRELWEGNGLNEDYGPSGTTCLTPRKKGDGWDDKYEYWGSDGTSDGSSDGGKPPRNDHDRAPPNFAELFYQADRDRVCCGGLGSGLGLG